MARQRKASGASAGAGAGVAELTGEPVEVHDEPVEVLTRTAAIDVAKDSAMVCAPACRGSPRIDGCSAPGRCSPATARSPR